MHSASLRLSLLFRLASRPDERTRAKVIWYLAFASKNEDGSIGPQIALEQRIEGFCDCGHNKSIRTGRLCTRRKDLREKERERHLADSFKCPLNCNDSLSTWQPYIYYSWDFFISMRMQLATLLWQYPLIFYHITHTCLLYRIIQPAIFYFICFPLAVKIRLRKPAYSTFGIYNVRMFMLLRSNG